MALPNKKEGTIRYFSENKHRQGKWKTKQAVNANRFYMMLWNFLSFKRAGVDKLSKKGRNTTIVLDLGSGNGSYSHWYLSKKTTSATIAVDWSFFALKSIPCSHSCSIYKVCADIHHLPFKSSIFTHLFSIDTLGHVSDVECVLDEIVRVASQRCSMFLHSECNDYQKRWPDSMLLCLNKKDVVAELDGHVTMHSSNHLLTLYKERFRVIRFFSPAGVFGWVLGYPEKYSYAFQQSHQRFLYFIVLIFSGIKKTPLLGILLRVINSFTNHIEVLLRINGGGSCFAFLEKK